VAQAFWSSVGYPFDNRVQRHARTMASS
jgi:hypothetical protein